jgi:hypothetical protein
MDTRSDERGLTVSERICGERRCIQVPHQPPGPHDTAIFTKSRKAAERVKVGDIIDLRGGKALVTHVDVQQGILTVVRNYGG